MAHRVVITGMAGVSPMGQDWPTARENILAGRNGVSHIAEWLQIKGQRAQLGAAIPAFDRCEHYGRRKIRSMGRVSLLATRATELALIQAGLLAEIGTLPCGIAFGSTTGSPPSIVKYAEQITTGKTMAKVSASDYMKFMSHTVLSNLAQFFEIGGRLVPSSAGCASATMAIGQAFELVKYGVLPLMLAGGSEELHAYSVAPFELLGRTSPAVDPTQQPRPFDAAADGLVVGEGAGCFVLESLEHALERGVPILGEVLGFASGCDPDAASWSSSREVQAGLMCQALDGAGLKPDQIDLVAAFAAGVPEQDISESWAIHQVFGTQTPVCALKSYLGHTLGASGALELWLALNMVTENWLAPTLNLTELGYDLAPLDYLREVRQQKTATILSNSFSLGGLNASLIVRQGLK